MLFSAQKTVLEQNSDKNLQKLSPISDRVQPITKVIVRIAKYVTKL
jgi:hypothetical protein